MQKRCLRKFKCVFMIKNNSAQMKSRKNTLHIIKLPYMINSQGASDWMKKAESFPTLGPGKNVRISTSTQHNFSQSHQTRESHEGIRAGKKIKLNCHHFHTMWLSQTLWEPIREFIKVLGHKITPDKSVAVLYVHSILKKKQKSKCSPIQTI